MSLIRGVTSCYGMISARTQLQHGQYARGCGDVQNRGEALVHILKILDICNFCLDAGISNVCKQRLHGADT